MGRLRALLPLALLVLAGCPTGIAGLECSTREDCLDNESCERGVCVVFRPDATPPGADAGTPKADAGRPKADAGRPDASQTVDAGPLPDAGDAGSSVDTGVRPDGGPSTDGGARDASEPTPDAAFPSDSGVPRVDAGTLPDAASCGANQESGPGGGCVPVFDVIVLSPAGESPAHGTAEVKLERFPNTTSPEPAKVRLKLARKNGATAPSVVDLLPSGGKYTGLYDLATSGEYQVEASFELNGTFAVTGLAQVKPTFGTARPAYPPGVRGDPLFPWGSFVRGLTGTVFVPVDVENVTPDAAKAEVKDAKGNEAPATSSWVLCGSTPDCPCTRTTLGCLTLTSDFYAANLFLEVRAQYSLHGGLSDDEGQPVETSVPVAVSRWRWAYSVPPGYRVFAPPTILPGGLVLAPTSSGPAGAGATNTVLLALDPSGAKVDSSAPLGGTAVRLATRSNGLGQQLAVVTQSLTGEDLYTGFFSGSSTGLFSTFTQHNLGGTGIALSRIGVAWLVPAGTNAPVLALAHVRTSDRNAQLKSWDPVSDSYVQQVFTGTLLSPALPVSADGANLYVGTSDGGHAQFKFLPSEIQAGPVTVKATEPTTFLVGPGQAWISQGISPPILFQPGLGGDSLTGQVLGLLGAVEGPLVVLPSAIWPGKWGQNGATSLPFAANAPTGGVVAHGDTLYLVAPSQNAGSFELLRRTSKAVAWSSWNLPGIPAGEPALDCLRGSTASLGVLYVPLLDGRLVALVVDEPGLSQSAPWPQPGRDPGRSYDLSVPIACP